MSFDTDEQSVRIFTTTVSPFFNFNEKGRLVIPPNTEKGWNAESFSTVARNIKSTVSELKAHIESLWEEQKQFSL